MCNTLSQGHRDNRLLAALSAEALGSLERDLRQVSLQHGTVIFEPGAPMDRVYFPQSGLISLLVITEDGTSIETATIGWEGALGLHRALGPRFSFTRAAVQIGGRFSVIRGDRFEQVAGNNLAIHALVGGYTELLWAEAQQVAACNVVHDASSRLCRWLLQTSDRIQSSSVPLTQEFLAQMLGVRRTTVTLLAQAMQRRGLIRYSRGLIEILDRESLQGCACECYRVTRLDRLPRAVGVKL